MHTCNILITVLSLPSLDAFHATLVCEVPLQLRPSRRAFATDPCDKPCNNFHPLYQRTCQHVEICSAALISLSRLDPIGARVAARHHSTKFPNQDRSSVIPRLSHSIDQVSRAVSSIISGNCSREHAQRLGVLRQGTLTLYTACTRSMPNLCSFEPKPVFYYSHLPGQAILTWPATQ